MIHVPRRKLWTPPRKGLCDIMVVSEMHGYHGMGVRKAFPQIVNTATGVAGANSTSYTMNLPSGIQASDIVLAHIAIEDTSGNVVWPGGWAELWDQNAVSQPTHAAAYRRCDGSEGSTITVTSSAIRSPDMRTLLIRGAHPTSNPEGASAVGTDNNANPPNLAPSWGNAPTLWVAMACAKWTNAFSTYPADYTLSQYHNQWTSIGGIPLNSLMAARQLEAASENPGSFSTTFGGTMIWKAGVAAIRGRFD